MSEDKTRRVRSAQQQADDFVRGNDASPVVSGRAIEEDPTKRGKGGVYTLADGRSFRLGLDACRLLPNGYPKWMDFGRTPEPTA